MSVSGPLRIAVIDHASAGGVSRFLLALLTHLAADHPDDVRISYFVSSDNIKRDKLDATVRRVRERHARADSPGVSRRSGTTG